MHIDGSVKGIIRTSTGKLHKTFTGQHLARITGQGVQKGKLITGQIKPRTVQGCLQSLRLKAQTPNLQHGMTRTHLPPHPASKSTDAGQQFTRRIGFRDIVIGSHLQAKNFVRFFAPRCGNEYGNIGMTAKLLADRYPITPRQAEIKKDDIITVAQCLPQTAFSTLTTNP